MKVPFTSQQSHQSVSTPKAINSNNNIVRNPTFQGSNNLFYEPKSVLELCQSPSPIADKSANKTEVSTVADTRIQYHSEEPLQPDDHGILSYFEDWESLMKELDLHEDSIASLKPNPQLTQSEPQYPTLPEFSPHHSFYQTQFVHSDFSLSDVSQHPPSNHEMISFNLLNDHPHINQWNAGLDYVDELIRVAEHLETNSFQLAHVILARLNQLLRSPTGKALQRAAFYFKEALQALLTGSIRPTRPSTSSEIVQTIKAYKSFSNLSPILMFSSFTANQAILEAVDGSSLVHIIDFDIGLGCHWASFMKELAVSRKANTPVLRITALVPEEYVIESRLTRENLTQFALELKIGFSIEFLLIQTFECLSFKAIKFVEGEKTAVLLSPTIFQRIGAGFVNDLRRFSPHVVVYADTEGFMGFGMSSFRQCVIDGLEFYSTVLESLEASNIGGAGGGGGGDWIRKIEMFVLLPKIFAAVEAAGHGDTPWREAFVGAGLRAVGLSQFADFQAECLLRKSQVRGFHVAKQQAEMVLCWHGRPLVATSAWRC